MPHRKYLADLAEIVEHFEFTPFPCFIKDLDGNVMVVNSAYEKMMNVSSERITEEGAVEEEFGPRTADTYLERDNIVADTLETHMWWDKVGLVVKWPILFGGECVAIGSIILQPKDLAHMHMLVPVSELPGIPRQ